MQLNTLVTVLSVTFLASTAFASGDHAGGHHSDAGAIGQLGNAAKVTRTITVVMTDTMRFSPAEITAKQGETIKFVVKNSGKIKHEMVLGTEKQLKEHNEVMKKNPEMEHADDNMVTVLPGNTGEIIWQFTKSGRVNFACLQPGHYAAGMKGAVIVGGKTMAAVPATDAVPEKPVAAPVASVASASIAMTEGEIRKIDKDNKKITIKHGEIKNLDMPGMTMVFQVKDPAMLEALKAGDKVMFSAEKSAGAIVVTAIQPSK
ncbi:MAG: copper-binding protein [Rhodocyclaceae bacterium]|nr:copper-binding protein [Rhodocyclaceae bacterium]